MMARYRILAVLAATLGASLVCLGLTYGRSRVAAWLDDSMDGFARRLTSRESRYVRSVLAPVHAPSEGTWRELEQLRHPTTVLWGIHDDGMPQSFEQALRLEKFIGTRLKILQLYVGWGDGAEQAFPEHAARLIWDAGSVPLVTWEPWLSAFTARLHPHLSPPDKRDDNGLRDIASGRYDFYIQRWADQAVAFGRHPLFIRFAHEMNDGQRYPWGPTRNPDPEDFKRAWRHVVSLFRERGANNVLFVWAPSISYSGFERYFPGPEWVDWVGTGVLNFGTTARWSTWKSCVELLQPHYPQLTRWGLPLMIAEFGSVATGGDRRAWYASAIEHIATDWPMLKAVIFFNVRADRTAPSEPLDWSIVTNTNSDVALAVKEGLRNWSTDSQDSTQHTTVH